MDFVIRFAQTHESFRLPEIEAQASLAGLKYEILFYDPESPFCIIRFPNLLSSHETKAHEKVDEVVRSFEQRAIISRSIYELWGMGTTYDNVHRDVRTRSSHLWDKYAHASFKFDVHCYGSTRDVKAQRQLIESFSYLGFQGKIKMKNPDVEFAVMEDWSIPLSPSRSAHTSEATSTNPLLKQVFLGRKIGDSRRHLMDKHDLKKRPYISTTSMDAELALVTANVALAAPGKLFLDPFAGTGGFLVAAAELGAVVMGSDIDGRSFRGKGTGLDLGVGANFKKYSLKNLFGDCITSDLTNTPFRSLRIAGHEPDDRWLDGIICDPPYGVREGLKVLGMRRPNSETDPDGSICRLINGIPAHTLPGYVAPKKAYSFTRMLDDILNFAARTLVDGGRLAFWMPSANENELGEEEVTVIPTHPILTLKHESIQRFTKWSRRLLVYERLPGTLGIDTSNGQVLSQAEVIADGHTADELNPFRKIYFRPASTH